MTTIRSTQSGESTHAAPGRGFHGMAAVLLGSGLSLLLYLHGSAWWLAPAAVVGIVLAHLLVFGGAAFIVTRFVGGRFHGAGGHPGVGLMLHKPRQYDWLVRVITLGREKKLRRWMLDLADLKPGEAVLDVGCGTGTLLLAAAERVGPAGSLSGVEPSEEMRSRAQHKAEERGIPLKLVEGSADAIPHPPSSFDAAFCTLVIHHLPPGAREGAIREMRRVLRPGGRAVIVDWQKPKTILGAILSGLLLMHILHNLAPSKAPLEAPGLEPLLRDLGFAEVTRCSFGGSVMGAVVCRLGAAGTGA